MAEHKYGNIFAPAVEQLRTNLDVLKTNAPINEKEGNHSQAKLERTGITSIKAAIKKLEFGKVFGG